MSWFVERGRDCVVSYIYVEIKRNVEFLGELEVI